MTARNYDDTPLKEGRHPSGRYDTCVDRSLNSVLEPAASPQLRPSTHVVLRSYDPPQMHLADVVEDANVDRIALIAAAGTLEDKPGRFFGARPAAG